MKAIDFVGAEIHSGDTIVYPIRQGSSMWLKKAVVTGIEPRKDSVSLIAYDPENVSQRRLNIKNLHTVVVVKKAA